MCTSFPRPTGLIPQALEAEMAALDDMDDTESESEEEEPGPSTPIAEVREVVVVLVLNRHKWERRSWRFYCQLCGISSISTSVQRVYVYLIQIPV